MAKKKLWKKLVVGLAIFGVVLAVAGFVFVNFYFEDYVNSALVPKLSAAVSVASRGEYALKIGRIKFSAGSIFGTGVNLFRLRYDSSEHGVVVKRLTIDTVLFHGIDWWKLIRGKGLYLKSIEINSPKLYTTDADAHNSSIDPTQDSLVSPPTSLPDRIPALSCDSILLSNIDLYLPTVEHPGSESTVHSVSLRIHDFFLDSVALRTRPLFFSKRVDFLLPSAHYNIADSLYAFEVVNMHGNLSDSLLTIDSFAYKPNFSDDAFAARQRYARGRLEFHCTNLELHGIDFTRLLSATAIAFRKCEVRTWRVDFYADMRKPANPHPPDAPMPNDLAANLKFAITLDSLILNDGTITIRNRQPGSIQEGRLFFTHAHVAAAPFSNDSTCVNCKKPTRVVFKADFLGEGIVSGVALYPLQQEAFDLDIAASVTGFDPKKLNPWLIPVERKQLSDGIVHSGEIKMSIRSGVSTTSVTPRYENLYMKILPTGAKEKSGILESIKSFLGNALVLRSKNLDSPNEAAMTARTVRPRKRTEEFFEFIWLSLRAALGTILGGFK